MVGSGANNVPPSKIRSIICFSTSLAFAESFSSSLIKFRYVPSCAVKGDPMANAGPGELSTDCFCGCKVTGRSWSSLMDTGDILVQRWGVSSEGTVSGWLSERKNGWGRLTQRLVLIPIGPPGFTCPRALTYNYGDSFRIVNCGHIVIQGISNH